MIISFSEYTFDIDVERTRAFYNRADVLPMGEDCGCIGCRNFDKAIMTVPRAVLDFLYSLGIEPRKPTEIYNVTGMLEDDGKIWYNGWYHICGTVVKSPETVKYGVNEKGNPTVEYGWDKGYRPSPGFPFAILPVKDNAFQRDGFPQPIIQLEIDTHLPYLLSEPFKA